MSLAAGQTLTHYEILGPLGVGGMGEVYRARDTRLEREVAIKVLPEELADDDERLRRFEREAKTLASLNHTNVAGIHGVDQVGDVCFLALELVPGEDLATLLARGPLAVGEGLDVCRQIAEGLEAAHEAGVVHRDLKPANVRVTPEGVVKILDFGLAKPIRPTSTKEGTTTAESDSFVMTEEGLVLGTPTYMSPEQARGKPVDRRTDIWAFGCVLYECLAGKRAFTGASLTDVLAAIVEREPDWGALPATLPGSLRTLVRRCLEKDSRTRLRDIGEARIALETPEPDALVEASPANEVRRPVLAIALVAAIGGLALGWILREARVPAETTADAPAQASAVRVRRFRLQPERDEDGEPIRWEDPTLSPDGAFLASTGEAGIGVRALDAFGTAWIPLDEKPDQVAWSPDSEFLAFVVDDTIWRVPRAGGRPMRTHIEQEGELGGGLAWLDDGRIAFVRTLDDIQHVSAIPWTGGLVEDLLTPEGQEAREEGVLPGHFHGLEALPGGRFIASFHSDLRVFSIMTADESGPQSLLEHGGSFDVDSPRWTSAGYLIYAASRSFGSEKELWAVPFSPEEFRTTGPTVPVETGFGDWSVSRDGTLVRDVVGDQTNQLAWWDPDDGLEPIGREHASLIRDVSFSRDGMTLVYVTGYGDDSVLWKVDLRRGVTQKTELDITDMLASAVLLPDGRMAVATIDEETRKFSTFLLPPSGRGDLEPWIEGRLVAIDPDARFSVVDGLGDGVHIVDLESGGEPRPFRTGGESFRFSAISPDGDWALYASGPSWDESQLYLTRFPSGEGDWQVSADGATDGFFASDGSEIIFLAGSGAKRVSFRATPEVDLGIPEPIGELGEGRLMPVQEPNGDRILAMRSDRDVEEDLIIVLDWARDLKAR